ncbi:MAG: VWA domain-containing protein [bacterium]|nr:VWA domain-containing protein [bacterium]
MASRTEGARPILANLLLFGRALRAAGLPVTHSQSLDFARALELVDVGSRDQVFHAARSFLVNRREELELFELLFNRFWRSRGSDSAAASAKGQSTTPQPRRDRDRLRPLGRVDYLAAASGQADAEIDLRERAQTFSDLEVLQRKDFSEMSAAELEELRRLILEMRWRASLRRTRRWSADSRGTRLHLGRVLREAARHGGTPLRLARRRRKTKRRPIVLLADISGSMEKYSRIILQFFYGALHGFGAGDVECFVFGTRLTCITSSLRIRNVDRALEDASAEILDWSGGTRIGESLGVFNRHWARRVLRRGAVVIIVSDGWERGDVSVLRREMRHLHHRSHRLIWLNPHVGRPGYEPLVEGMVGALPFIDDFLPIHNLESLRALGDALAELPARKRLSNSYRPAKLKPASSRSQTNPRPAVR